MAAGLDVRFQPFVAPPGQKGSLSNEMSKLTASREAEITARVLKHWHEAVPNDRMAHLVKDVARSFLRSLQVRLAVHGVTLGHWTFLRILWERDGLTQRELSLLNSTQN